MIPSATQKINLPLDTNLGKAPAVRSDSASMTEGNDHLFTSKTDQLIQLLEVNRRVRPEVIQRAQALANDPGYPSSEIIRRLSEMILKAEDPSEKLD